MEPHLSQRAGLFAFGHDFLRQAVEAAFVPSGDFQQAAHLSVADYFDHHTHQREMTPRKASEWPYQLHAAAAWDRLEACLTDIPLFLAVFNDKTQWELQACERILGPEHPDTLTSVNNLALFLNNKGDYVGAEPLYRRALESSERVLGPEHSDTLERVHNLAALLVDKGDYAGAEPLHRRAIDGLLRISATIERPHPNLETFVLSYADCLLKQRRSHDDIRNTVESMLRPFGLSVSDVCGRAQPVAQPSSELRAVIEQLMRDPSKGEELAAKLQREDPELLMELMQWIQSQQ